MEFEWDSAKDATNRRKHGIGFREAAEIFRGPIDTREDTRRDYGERRFIALGEYDGEVIRVVFTGRGSAVRIISAWKANRNERQQYKQKLKEAQQDRPV
jgi:uncharacterized DUF497 family protein